MDFYQELFLYLMMISLAPLGVSLFRGWHMSPDPRLQRRGARMMLITVIAAGVCVLFGAIGLLATGKYLMGASATITVVLMLIASTFAINALRSADYRVRTGEHLPTVDAVVSRMVILSRVMLGLAAVAIVLFFAGIITSITLGN